jgi:hypothetical protein
VRRRQHPTENGAVHLWRRVARVIGLGGARHDQSRRGQDKAGRGDCADSSSSHTSLEFLGWLHCMLPSPARLQGRAPEGIHPKPLMAFKEVSATIRHRLSGALRGASGME